MEQYIEPHGDGGQSGVPWWWPPLSDQARVTLQSLRSRLRAQVIGQDEAIDAVVRRVRRTAAGLNDPKRPVGAFLWLGPSGTGKTALALAVAQVLYEGATNFLRLDMSEFMEKEMLWRLIGPASGFKDADEGGQLTNALRLQPYRVVLFDEIEKAHPDVFNILLQMLDGGRLTDGRGKTVDCTKALYFLTSNVGAQEIKEYGDDPAAMERAAQAALRRTFRPELLNRLDEIIVFRPLSAEAMRQIAHRELPLALEQVSAQGVVVRPTEAAIDAIAREAFAQADGARPLKQLVRRYVIDPLTDGLLDGAYRAGDVLDFDFEPAHNRYRMAVVQRAAASQISMQPHPVAAPPALPPVNTTPSGPLSDPSPPPRPDSVAALQAHVLERARQLEAEHQRRLQALYSILLGTSEPSSPDQQP